MERLDKDSAAIAAVDAMNKSDGWVMFYYSADADADSLGFVTNRIREVEYIAALGVRQYQRTIDRSPDVDDDCDDDA